MGKYSGDRGYKAFRTLQVAFVIVPFLAGLDKFMNYFTTWSKYLSPTAMNVIDGHTNAFFMIVGVIEIIAALGVLFKPRIFAFVVSAWLLLIVLNLLMLGSYLDVALRDVGLMLGAFAFGQLALKYDV
jgi:hypothetical protein